MKTLSAFTCLTPTENRVVELLVKGWGNKQIAKELYISLRTVESHVSSILCKTGQDNRAAVVGLYYQEHEEKPLEKLVEPDTALRLKKIVLLIRDLNLKLAEFETVTSKMDLLSVELSAFVQLVEGDGL